MQVLEVLDVNLSREFLSMIITSAHVGLIESRLLNSVACIKTVGYYLIQQHGGIQKGGLRTHCLLLYNDRCYCLVGTFESSQLIIPLKKYDYDNNNLFIIINHILIIIFIII